MGWKIGRLSLALTALAVVMVVGYGYASGAAWLPFAKELRGDFGTSVTVRLPFGAARPPTNPDIILATTTSTQDSGLLDVLIPAFEAQSGYRVKTIAVGTGQALALGARGEADVLLVHAPDAELQFMADGHGSRRLRVMHNDFIVVGPPDDPAGIRGESLAHAARQVSQLGRAFLSRGDNSGTDQLEKKIWRELEIDPRGQPWYIEVGQGMGQTLLVASERGAYTVTDRATFLARRSGLQLAVVVEGDDLLLNVYHVIPVNSQTHPKINAPGSEAFAEFMVAPATQKSIGEFGREKFGEALFFPNPADSTSAR